MFRLFKYDGRGRRTLYSLRGGGYDQGGGALSRVRGRGGQSECASNLSGGQSAEDSE